ncbi:hypothetical protein DNK63_13500 [Providencia rettgeri]|nr:hypothetical protein DNK63_13500 [Providencia rettgeri]
MDYYEMTTEKDDNDIILKKNAIEKDDSGNIIINGKILIDNQEFDGLVIYSYEIIPNNYHDLIQMNESNKITIKLFNVRAKGIDGEFRARLNIDMGSTHNHFLLVKNGWIPCIFMKKNTLLFADRNVISKIQYRYFLNKKKDTTYDYFDSMFLPRNQLTIDLTLWSLEANEKRIPSADIIDNQLIIAKNILKLALPDIAISEYPNGNKYYHELSNYLKNIIEKRMNFLIKVAPTINRNFTEKTRDTIVEKIFLLADEFKLKRADIAVVLVFLRVNLVKPEGEKSNLATEVIKESQTYGLNEAYNTACDLSAIELLVNMIRKSEKENSPYNIAFLSEDKGLIKLGSLVMNYKNDKTDGKNVTISSSFPRDIFANDTKFAELISRYIVPSE